MIQDHQAVGVLNDPPRLDPRIDCAASAKEFQHSGRVQIDQVLTPSSAQRVHSCLMNETPYALHFNGTREKDLRNVTPQQREEYAKTAWHRVGVNGFQFLYDKHTLSYHGEPYSDPHHYWTAMTSFLNGAEFLGLAHKVTGIEAIGFADAQATLYRPGYFLTAHDDNRPGANRLVAYVLSFTAPWRPEWGGLLEFIDETGRIEASYAPSFNSLKLFRIPKRHYVSCVAPYAMAGRYSITGWLRAR